MANARISQYGRRYGSSGGSSAAPAPSRFCRKFAEGESVRKLELVVVPGVRSEPPVLGGDPGETLSNVDKR